MRSLKFKISPEMNLDKKTQLVQSSNEYQAHSRSGQVMTTRTSISKMKFSIKNIAMLPSLSPFSYKSPTYDLLNIHINIYIYKYVSNLLSFPSRQIFQS